MTAAEKILQRLEKVRRITDGRWMAKCPSHDDGRASLSLRQIDDRLLINCFAGCGAADIVAALGLSLGDLFEQPLKHSLKGVAGRHWHGASEALKSIKFDSLIILFAGEQLAAGTALSGPDRKTLLESVARVRRVCEVVHG